MVTEGTAAFLQLSASPRRSSTRSQRLPNIVDAIRAGDIHLVINTPRGGQAHYDGALIRGTAGLYGVPIITTMSAATATVQGIKALRQKPLTARSLQVHHHTEPV